MSVANGQTAPEIQLFDDQMNPFRLSAQKGRNVLLLFYPGAFTSVCTAELNTVNNDKPAYGEDTVIVGISTDSPFVQREFKKANRLTFPLLSDDDAVASSSFGVKFNKDFTAMNLDRISKRSAFVIDREGIVRYAAVLENAGEQPDYDAIKATLVSL